MATSARLAGWALASALRLQARTWRRRVAGLESIDRLRAAGRRVLVAFWHGKYVALFPLLGVRGGCVFTSRSFRGEVIGEICRRFGHEAIAIPAHGADAVALIDGALRRAGLGALAVDGPVGPARAVKRGAIEVAARAGALVLPVAVAARRKWALAGRWDRMEIPRPFTRVHLAVGEPIEVPPALDASGVDAWCERLRAALAALDERVEEAAAGGVSAAAPAPGSRRARARSPASPR